MRRARVARIDLPALSMPTSKPSIGPPIDAARIDALRGAAGVRGLDLVIVYADREHSANINDLTGFDPRFEEAVLIVGPDGDPGILVGNECWGSAGAGPVPLRGHMLQDLSLPNQPRDRSRPLAEILGDEGVVAGARVGVIGWKRYIDPAHGLRTTNEVDQIAAFEHASCQTSDAAPDHRRPVSAAVIARNDLDIAPPACANLQPEKRRPAGSEEDHMHQSKRALMGVGGAAAIAASLMATGASMAQSPAASMASGEGITVGVSWNNFNEPRWAAFDEPAIKAALEAAGATYISTDAASSAEQQVSDVENLISQGADALIILAQDGTAILPAVQGAINQGIPVVAYDRLIENDKTLYLSFDNVGVGKIMAETIFPLVPKGNYAIIKGNQADANADFLRSGMEQVIGDAVASGDIVIPEACETYTDNWDPANAQTEMENCLTSTNNDIQAVLAENDGMAGGVIAALQAQGMAGTIPVSGQDGDPGALNRVALGTQTVSVWKDARALGKAAGEAAVALAADSNLADLAGTAPFTSPGGNTLTSEILAPTPITKDNLQVVVDAGVITQEALCQGVTAGSVTACP